MTHKRVLSTEAAIKGTRFGSLLAIRLAGRMSGHSQVWVFRCDCGARCERSIDSVRHSADKVGFAGCPSCTSTFHAARPVKTKPSAVQCGFCAGMPHRRPEIGKCQCGGVYADDVVEFELDRRKAVNCD